MDELAKKARLSKDSVKFSSPLLSAPLRLVLNCCPDTPLASSRRLAVKCKEHYQSHSSSATSPPLLSLDLRSTRRSATRSASMIPTFRPTLSTGWSGNRPSRASSPRGPAFIFSCANPWFTPLSTQSSACHNGRLPLPYASSSSQHPLVFPSSRLVLSTKGVPANW